jgi:hypothetical protein
MSGAAQPVALTFAAPYSASKATALGVGLGPISDDTARQVGEATPDGASTLADAVVLDPEATPKTAARPPRPSTARSRRAASALGIVVILVLCGFSMALAFRGGAYGPADWLPLMVAIVAFAVIVCLGGPAVVSDRFQKLLLGLFAAQAVWTAASMLWATSLGNTWEEINRTLLYAVGVALVFAAVRWAGLKGLTALATLLAAVVGVVGLVVALTLASSDNPMALFEEARLNYPVTYYNGLSALLMLGFWLALGMATGAGTARKRRGDTGKPADDVEPPRSALPRWAQPLLLMLAVLLAELALLPQSRGALWTFFLVVPFFVILSSNRFRALVDLAIVALPAVAFWNTLNGVYVAIKYETPFDVALSAALQAIGYSVLIVLGAWAVTFLVERGVGATSRRVTAWIGVTLIVLAVAGMAGGLVYADQRTGGLVDYIDDKWGEIASDAGTTSAEAESRLSAVSLNGRLSQWRVALRAFDDNPILGIGAQNFELYHSQHRTNGAIEVRQPHSQPVQLLAELGLPGLLLWLAFVALVLVRAVTLRFRSSSRAQQVAIAAVATAVISWLIHSSADWLWQLAAVSLPAMMLMGGLIGAGGPSERRVLALFKAPVTGPRERRSAAHDRRSAERSVAESGAVATAESATSVADKLPSAPRRSPAAPRGKAHGSLRVSRAVLCVLALVVLASALFPYLSLRYSNLAAGSLNLEAVTAQTSTAHTLDPTSVIPYTVRASAHAMAATAEIEGSAYRVEQYRLAAEDWADAAELESGYWLYSYQTAEAFLAARDAAREAGDQAAVEEFTQLARTYLNEADRLNPLSRQVDALEKLF